MDISKKFGVLCGFAEAVPEVLIGATILEIGAGSSGDLSRDGLVIRFKPTGSNSIMDLVLAFSEEGMWVTSLTGDDASQVNNG